MPQSNFITILLRLQKIAFSQMHTGCELLVKYTKNKTLRGNTSECSSEAHVCIVSITTAEHDVCGSVIAIQQLL